VSSPQGDHHEHLQKALRPENDGTPNAIVSRSKTALDRLDGKLLGDPANIVISEDRKTAFVVNHHGAIDNDEFLQHGGRGGIARTAATGSPSWIAGPAASAARSSWRWRAKTARAPDTSR